MSWEILGGAALGGLGSILNNERNLAFQKDAQDWNIGAQEKTWQREDDAVQRRVNDLRLAGLHPTLAAGSAAQAGSPTKIDPMNSTDSMGIQGMLGGAASAAQTQQSIMNTQAQEAGINLTNANVAKTAMDTALGGKELLLYGEGEQGARRHPKYEDKWIRMAEMAYEAIQKAMGVSPRAKAKALKNPNLPKIYKDKGKVPAWATVGE